MKFKFKFMKSELNVEANVEKIVEKHMDNKASNPVRKTKYQIKQEEKRKNAILKHKQTLTYYILGFSAFAAIIALCLIMSFLGN